MIITLGLRLVLAFSIPNLTYDSYFHLQQIEHITETGMPLYQDPLSYGGRTLVFLPAFHYFMATFDLFLPLELAAKIITNLLVVSLILLVYLLAKRITQSENAALVSAVIAAIVPATWQTNSVSPYYLFLPLMLLAIYALMNIQQKKFVYLYIIMLFLLSLTTTATFFLIVGILFYIILSKIEEKSVLRAEMELTLFSLFLFLWVQFLFFKNILISEGIGFIWQNIPPQIVYQYFPVSLPQSLALVGAIPLLVSIYSIYKFLYEEKNKNVFLLFSLAISTILLFMLKLVEARITLMLLGVIFAIIFAQFYKSLGQYLKQTKLVSKGSLILSVLVILAVLTSAYASFAFAIQQQTPSQEDITAFLWLKENTPPNSTVLTILKEGHLLNYLGGRKNLMDEQFSLIKNIEGRFNDLSSLYITSYQTQAIDLLNKYSIDYIFFSEAAEERYQIEKISYIDEKCFDLVYDQEVKIYRSKCQLQPTK
ncbi:MAG: glycosyltransferase family 39 protein [Candidatus Woesearchaeota archaeon]